jgi:hypothetical protein
MIERKRSLQNNPKSEEFGRRLSRPHREGQLERD